MYDFTPILARIKIAKKSAGLTSDELSAKSGVPIGTLRKILAGATTEPKLPALMSIAQSLEVSVDWLIYGTCNNSNKLSLVEENLLAAYRAASPDDRAIIDNIVSRYTHAAEIEKHA